MYTGRLDMSCLHEHMVCSNAHACQHMQKPSIKPACLAYTFALCLSNNNARVAVDITSAVMHPPAAVTLQEFKV